MRFRNQNALCNIGLKNLDLENHDLELVKILLEWKTGLEQGTQLQECNPDLILVDSNHQRAIGWEILLL